MREQFPFEEERDEGFEEEGSRRRIRGGVGFWEGGGEFEVEVGLEVVCVVGFDVAGEGMKDGFDTGFLDAGLAGGGGRWKEWWMWFCGQSTDGCWSLTKDSEHMRRVIQFIAAASARCIPVTLL